MHNGALLGCAPHHLYQIQCSVGRWEIRSQSRSLPVSLCSSRVDAVALTSGVCTLDACTFPSVFFPNVKASRMVSRNSPACSAADQELFIWKVFRPVCWRLSPCVQHCLGSAWRGTCTSALPRGEEALAAHRQLSRYNLKSFLVCRVWLQFCGWEQPSRSEMCYLTYPSTEQGLEYAVCRCGRGKLPLAWSSSLWEYM